MAQAQVEAMADATAEVSAQVDAKASSDAEYKSDALDELLEGSLFKKKKPDHSEESQVDQALHAKVDLKEFNLVSEKTEEAKPSEEAQAEVAPGSVPDPNL